MPKPIFALCVSFMICIATYHLLTAEPSTEPCNNGSEIGIGSPALNIQCPADITVHVPANSCLADVIIPPPVSDDANCPIISLTNSLTGMTDPSGIYAAQILEITWTVEDDCGQMNQCEQTISVLDIVPPTLTCPPDITTGNSDDGRNTMVIVDAPIASDNCSLESVINDYNDSADASDYYPVGTTFLQWTALDTSGNSTVCQMAVIVFDNTPPQFFCPDGENYECIEELPLVYATYAEFENEGGNAIDETALDTASFNLLEENSDGMSNPETIIRIYVISDEAGNSATCSQEFIINDTSPPLIHDPLPDISISCEFPLDLDDLSVFGFYVAEGQPRSDIIINDHFYLPSGLAGRDGVYFENCSDITVSVDTSMFLDMCNRGRIERNFTIIDGAGHVVETTQNIYIIDVQPFSLSNIVWPNQNVYLNDCQIVVPDPDSTGRPQLTNDKCSMAAATFKDLAFPNNNYCRVIRRVWTVLDWCQYVPNTNIGKWTFEQYIYISNDVPPTIDAQTCAATQVCTPNGSCTGQLNFTANGTDDCTPVQITWSYKIDEGNNNTIDFTGTGKTINRSVFRGTHRIIWEAKDKCGNLAVCEKVVQVRECKAPNGVVFYGLSINLSAPMAMASIHAKSFNNGSYDNCTPSPALKFSYSSQVNDTLRTYNCSHLGQQPVEIWITDLEGNQSIVHTYVIVQDNDLLCSNIHTITVSGNVYTVDKKPLAHAKIMVEGGETFVDQMTEADGIFTFKNLGMFNDYRIMGEKSDEALKGVSTLDLVLIQRHILGIEKFDNPLQIIAGDIDESGKINTVDLVNLRKLILGLTDTFPKNRPWIFVKENQKYLDGENPWLENLDYLFDNLDTNQTNINFTSIKVGDVNHSYTSDLKTHETASRSNEIPVMVIEDKTVPANQIVSVPFEAKNFNEILAQQFTLALSPDIEYIGFEADGMPLQVDQIAEIEKEGKHYITLAFHDVSGFSLTDGKILFQLYFKSKKSTRASHIFSLSDEVTPTKIYFEDTKSSPLFIQFQMPKNPESASIKQNQPNPFKDETSIECHLIKNGVIHITLYDGAGKLIYENRIEGWPGINRFNLGIKELGESRGIIYAKITTDEMDEVIKMLRIE